MYEIINNEELLGRLQGINNWIEENQSHIGNANMYEIMSAALARNNISELGQDVAASTFEIGRMVGYRSDSITEFLEDVPEVNNLFNEVVFNGLTGSSKEEMEFICKAISVPFFINNTRRRGFDGDITMPEEEQASCAIPGFKHDNRDEIEFLVRGYENASDNIREASYPIVNWVINNSVDEIKMVTSISPIETGYGK